LSLPKVFFVSVIIVFGFIGIFGLMKKSVKSEKNISTIENLKIEEVAIQDPQEEEKEEGLLTEQITDQTEEKVDLVDSLFQIDIDLPIVKTITYTSRVPWLSGRPAWVADYASHYETSRHFIARSLNGEVDYHSQNVSPGDRFNVLKKDIEFYLALDLSTKKLFFYAYDKKADERYLLKTYLVAVGKKDPKKASGCYTPLGVYSLGNKVALYKPGVTGYFQDRQIEMIRVFGTRWIPLGKEISGCSEVGKKTRGLHGAPWIPDASGELVEDRDSIGKNVSDGSIRLFQEDIEEIFSIVITKPSFLEVAKDIKEAHLPGKEVEIKR